MVTSIRWWWRQPDHFEWLSAFLHVRRMATMTRGVVVAVTSCLAAVPFVVLLGSAPPASPLQRTLSVLAGLGGLAGAALWLHHFPTKNQSIVFSVTASFSIACAVLAQSDPLTAMLGCTTFASISGYIALFHTPALMVANLLVVIAVTAVPAVALVGSDGYVRTVSAYAVVLIGNVAVPYGVQIIVHTLGVDLLKADRDPLTGLYNRRAFLRRAGALAATNREGSLLIAMIDLDRFKRLNDTHGHSHGDRALAAVGRALRDHAPRGSVIGRAGGEEFLVAVDLGDADPRAVGHGLRRAIEVLPFATTASVGTTCVPIAEIPAGDGAHDVITELIAAADAAMYEAKRNGGNQTRHHGRPTARQARTSSHRTWSSTSQRWEALPSPRPNDLRYRRRDSERFASW
ncbi:GGDEF domain-containing protein [Mycobacterium yunnanensis]|uniref:GGDEF domain-containing protein n=1 Tax=Mycobacterium yunnanensis TaxID=368477 RepID=A0A9X3C039_9MYCO|nr:GGDEF domain-containing protein [Mycobacterium yunnanensis]MCV7420338.1 GGDEF domain-containing protein [Mycobacterium yunnanensis]